MAITAKMVKELREKTGAGMMDCKKALEETNGNIEEAIDYLRKQGVSQAAKKADRIAAEGSAHIEVAGNTAVLLEVNCETDFVTKNEQFQTLLSDLGDRKSTRLNSSHVAISYAVFCLKKKKNEMPNQELQTKHHDPSRLIDGFVLMQFASLEHTFQIVKYTQYTCYNITYKYNTAKDYD